MLLADEFVQVSGSDASGKRGHKVYRTLLGQSTKGRGLSYSRCVEGWT